MIKLEELSASELGTLVNEGKIKPTEVVKYFEKRIKERNESINAYVYTKFDEAYMLAKRQEELLASGHNLGPFAGVPYALKDFLPNKIGWLSSHGGVKCLVALDTINSSFNEAMERAGGIALGKTNAPSYGFRGTTDNKMFGPTSTPFNPLYNAGGSSGGSAAAVCDGLALIAEGGDAGGSIRIPASYCNLFGFKAGIGTIPNLVRPDAYSTSHPYCFNGGLTKTVLDSAILLNYMKGFNPLDPNSYFDQTDYVKEMYKDVSKMKIAYTADFGIFELEPSVKKQFLDTIDRFKNLGLEISEHKFNFKHSALKMANAWCYGITIDCAIELNLLKENGIDLLKDHKCDFPDEFIYWKNKCDQLGIMDLYEFNLIRTDVLDEFEEVFKNFDFILSPISSIPAILNDENTKGPTSINGHEVEPLIGWTQTFLANFTGHPAASIPAGLDKYGVPFGLQLISRKHNEADLFAISRAYEEKYPWHQFYKIALERKI